MTKILISLPHSEVILPYFDFAKVFAKELHKELLYRKIKLVLVDVSANFFKNLRDRKRCEPNSCSKSKKLGIGTVDREGLTFGAVLFCFFINHLLDILKKSYNFSFRDDLNFMATTDSKILISHNLKRF